jgi:hypothetical protein
VARAHDVEHVVAADGRDPQSAQAEASRDFGGGERRGSRVRGAHVRDNPYACRRARSQHGFHARPQQRIEPEGGIAQFLELGQCDGPLAQALEAEVSDIAVLGEFDRGLDAVARVSGARSDADGLHSMAPFKRDDAEDGGRRRSSFPGRWNRELIRDNRASIPRIRGGTGDGSKSIRAFRRGGGNAAPPGARAPGLLRRQSLECRQAFGDMMKWLLVDRVDRHPRAAKSVGIVERADFQDHRGHARA